MIRHINNSQVEIKTKDGRTAKTVFVDERICFGILWFATEADAAIAHDAVREEGRCYNGGYFHGMPCGRSKTWDQPDEAGAMTYAVTY
jgi:hypothetical protein